MSSFGDVIKQLRKEKRITQRDLAQQVGIDFTYLSKIENNATGFCPSEAKIISIAQALDTDANTLILLAKKVPVSIRDTIIEDDLASRFLRIVPKMTEEQRKRFNDYLNEVK